MPFLSHDFFGLLATIISVVAFAQYIRSILKKQTRPSGPAWWTWSVLAIITVSSAYSAGATWQVLILPLWMCFSQLLVAILSLKHGDNNWDWINKFSILLGIISIFLWLITGQPLIALILVIIADFFA